MKNTSKTELNNKFTVTRDDQELDYWSKEFGISIDDLLKVVNKGGTSAEAVEKYVREMQVA